MIFQVLADVRLIQDASYAGGFQLCARPDARQHQQVRGADGTRTEDDFLVCTDLTDFTRAGAVNHAFRFQSFQDHLCRHGVGYDRKIRPLLGFALKKRLISAGSFSLFCGGLEQRCHGNTAPITSIVIAALEACGLGGLHKCLRGRDDGRTHGDPQGAIAAVGRCVDCDLGGSGQPLAFAEIGQYLVIAPTGRAAFGPGVEVPRMAADIGHVVNR